MRKLDGVVSNIICGCYFGFEVFKLNLSFSSLRLHRAMPPRAGTVAVVFVSDVVLLLFLLLLLTLDGVLAWCSGGTPPPPPRPVAMLWTVLRENDGKILILSPTSQVS